MGANVRVSIWQRTTRSRSSPARRGSSQDLKHPDLKGCSGWSTAKYRSSRRVYARPCREQLGAKMSLVISVDRWPVGSGRATCQRRTICWTNRYFDSNVCTRSGVVSYRSIRIRTSKKQHPLNLVLTNTHAPTPTPTPNLGNLRLDQKQSHAGQKLGSPCLQAIPPRFVGYYPSPSPDFIVAMDLQM